MRIKQDEYAKFYQTYIDKADTSKSIVENLQDTIEEAITLLKEVPKEKYLYKYADDKWTIQQLIEHIIDAEKVFSYRALRFARNDTTNLPGFDENSYVANANSNTRNYQELVAELTVVRKSTIFMFANFNDQVLLRKGTIDGNEMTVRAIGYVNSGHLKHHIGVLKERYL